MTFTNEKLGQAKDPEGNRYALDFYGQNDGATCVSGPLSDPGEELSHVREVHREQADNAADAKVKLAAWLDQKGWSYDFQ